MVRDIVFIAVAAIAIICAMAALYFACLILGWTFGATVDPIMHLVHLCVWLVPLSLSLFSLKRLWMLDQQRKRGQGVAE